MYVHDDEISNNDIYINFITIPDMPFLIEYNKTMVKKMDVDF